MPRFRADLGSIPVYVPGKPMDEVSRELGITELAKLASNECPVSPFPEVVEAIAAVAGEVNRYPDNSAHHLVAELAAALDVDPAGIWLGAGSTQLLLCTALAVGGPGTSAVYADPSFVMYPIATRISGGREIVVPLDAEHRHDLETMAKAVTDDTTVVYVCNPNNPTGTIVSGDDLEAFLDQLPLGVLAVIDEAYAEYAVDPTYRSMVDLAARRDDVLVTRTFSKVYGLAGLRIGYAIGTPATIAGLRRTQVPFSANRLGQVAARAALRHRDRVAARVAENSAGRRVLCEGLRALGVACSPSETNFVAAYPERDAAELAAALLRRGVIVRPMGPILRITVGTPAENERFLAALGEILR